MLVPFNLERPVKPPSLKRFSLALLLTVCLCACGTSTKPPTTNPPPANADLQGQLTGWRLGEASLSATFFGPGDLSERESIQIAAGTLQASGQFTADFSDSVGKDALLTLPVCDALTVSGEAARINTFSALDVRVGDEQRGLMALASSARVLSEGLQAVGEYYVQWLYADREVSLKGDCAITNPPTTLGYDLTLQKGWNTVTFRLERKDATGQTLVQRSEAVTDEAAWFYTEQ